MGDLGKFAKMNTLSEEEKAVLDSKGDREDALIEKSESDDGNAASYEDSIENEDDEGSKAEESDRPVKDNRPVLDFESGDYMEFDVIMTSADMFRFMMRHAYYGMTGVIGLLISAASVVALFAGLAKGNTFSMCLLIFAALMFTVINPLTIFFRARKQAQAVDSEKAPYTYTIGDAGIKVSRLEESVPITWDNIMKVREGKTSIYMYLAVNRAFVLPKNCFEGREEKLKGFIKKYVPAGRCRLN